jgi:tripeptide aminopeptidase
VSDQRLLATFLDLVRIDSPTGHEAGVAAYVADAHRSAGMEVTLDATAAATGSDVGNLVATLPGSEPGRTLVLSAHMDTVDPGCGVEPIVADGVVRSAGETILGSDDKAGIAAIVESMRRLAESGKPHATVRVVVTVGEEQGLLGAKHLSPEATEGDIALVLDADGEPGGIVTAAPTHHTFTATFLGRSAHAGVEPEKGISAIVMASRAIASMELGRLDAETTANIGSIGGGRATNVVAETTIVTGECRSLDPERASAVRDAMDHAMHLAASEAGGSVAVTWRKEYDGFRFADDDPSLRFVEGACLDEGLTPRTFATGGGSDGNIFASHGTPTFVLSSGMRDVHSTGEWIAVADLEALARLLDAALARAVEA